MHNSSISESSEFSANSKTQRLGLFAFALFFIFGSITSLNDVLIPKLKSLFNLSYGEAMLVQSAFFMAYFIASIPAGQLITRIGYMKSAVVGLLTMAVGCSLFIPATKTGLFISFLGALFILAVGVTVVQVVANPLTTLLGPSSTAHSRLTIGHAFNSLGTTIAPYVGAILILGGLNQIDPNSLSSTELKAFLQQEAAVISHTYIGIAIALIAVAIVVWMQRNRLPASSKPMIANPLEGLTLLKQPRFAMGAACIFLYVGAEVAIGSLMTNFLMERHTLNLSAEIAGQHVALYWGGAMVGRFIGAALLRKFAPGKLLACASIIVLSLLLSAGSLTGFIAGWSLLAIGCFNSIMFPTIFALASEGLGARAAQGSGLICCAIVGGAIVPPITGILADYTSLGFSLAVPALCYVGIAFYGWYARRPLATF